MVTNLFNYVYPFTNSVSCLVKISIQARQIYRCHHIHTKCKIIQLFLGLLLTNITTFQYVGTPISFPEPALPLSCGTGNERLWDKVFQVDISLAEKKHAQLNRKLKENYFPKSNNRIPVENGGQNTCEVFASTSKSTTRF